MRALLETTTISDILDRESNTIARINALRETDIVAVSLISYGEIWFGLEIMPKGQRRREYEHEAFGLFSTMILEPVTQEVSLSYAQIKARLRRMGEIIPEADLWIAATAVAENYTLVTCDAHFSRVQGLTIENWSKPYPS